MSSRPPDDLTPLLHKTQEDLIARRLGYELDPQPAAPKEKRPSVDPEAVAREAQAALVEKGLQEKAAIRNPTSPRQVAQQAQAAMLLKTQRAEREAQGATGGPAAGTAPTGGAWQQGRASAPKPSGPTR